MIKKILVLLIVTTFIAFFLFQLVYMYSMEEKVYGKTGLGPLLFILPNILTLSFVAAIAEKRK